MATKQFFTGMTGVFLVAAELSRRNFIVSPTSRGAIGADLLVTDSGCKKAYSVQVKTDTTTNSFWLLNKKAKNLVSPSHFYVLVSLKKNGEKDFYVMPSKVVAQKVRYDKNDETSNFPYITYKDAEPYRDAWHLFEE